MTKEPNQPGYYDLMAQLGVPYFHWGGMRATEELLRLCQVDLEKRLLVVGCGSGYSACHAARTFGCKTFGVDLSEGMLERAKQRAQRMALADRVEFQAGDAYSLPFKNDCFDGVITEFVTMFLDRQKAFTEYVRVLKPGGWLGLNEIFKAEDIAGQAEAPIQEAESRLREITGLPFVFSTASIWKKYMRDTGLEEIFLKRLEDTYRLSEYTKAAGGAGPLIKMAIRALYHLLFNRRFRSRLMLVGKVKQVLMTKKKTKQYVGALLCVGRKPSPL